MKKTLLDLEHSYYLPNVKVPEFTRYEYFYMPIFNFINFCLLKYKITGLAIQLFNYYVYLRFQRVITLNPYHILFRSYTDIDTNFTYEYHDRENIKIVD
jgi:hypothetical protein